MSFRNIKTAIRLSICVLALSLTSQTTRADFMFGQGGLTTPSAGDTLVAQMFLSQNVVGAVGQNNFGIGYIASISDVSKPGSPLVWAQGVGGQGQLTFTFNNFAASSITPSGPNQNIMFTGGNLTAFYNTGIVHNFAGALGSNAIPDASGTFAVGTQVLNTAGVGGIVPSDLTITLAATVTSLTSPLSGGGAGNLAVTGGTGDLFNFLKDQFLFLQTTFIAPDPNQASTGGSGSTAASVQNFTVPQETPGIPEPTALLLWGLAAGSAGLYGRYRVRKA